MSYVPAWLAHRDKRWMRENARLFTRPDAERWRQHNPGLYGGAPNVPANNARSAAWSVDEAAQAAAEAEFTRELKALQREHDRLRCAFAELKFDIAMRHLARKAGFDPDQPRVPAGNPDGGQWTSEGGGNDPRVLSDATADNDWIRGAQYAQDTTRYSVELHEEEMRGGHTLRDHVGKSDGELLDRVRTDRGQAGVYRYARSRQGSFDSREAANDLVNRTLEKNMDLVDLVATGRSPEEFLTTRFGSRTGKEAFRPSIDAEPYLRDTYEVGVDIRHDPRAVRGYRIHTAYPRNSSPR